MADDPDGLTALYERPDEADRPVILAQGVRIDRSTRQGQRVVVADRGLRHQAIHREAAQHVLDREQLGLRAGPLDGSARLDELHLLDAAGGEDRDSRRPVRVPWSPSV